MSYRPAPYDPKTVQLRSWHDRIAAFRDGSDSPRAYLERCLETIAEREPTIRAFVATSFAIARKAADKASARYKAGQPLSVVDGMPIAIKDLYDVADMPTELNSPTMAGYRPQRDCAHVYALRRGGAAILAKAVTTEFGQADPGPTRNPFDPTRTPGGSSSGSAAAVGAAMLPVATGSQVRGSIQRPAGYCGAWSLKPTFGALNRAGGHSMSPSQSVLGTLAASLEDCWATAFYISSTAGGDAGQPGLYGEPALGAAVKPKRLIRLDTPGWATTEGETRDRYEAFLKAVQAQGVEIVSRRDDADIEALEKELDKITSWLFALFAWEMRWPGLPLRDRGAHLISDAVLSRIARGEQMTIADYRRCLEARKTLCAAFAKVKGRADACISLSADGPPGTGFPVGNPIYGDVSSCLFAPAFNLPLLEDRGLPMGIQILGHPHEDYALARLGRWFGETFLGR